MVRLDDHEDEGTSPRISAGSGVTRFAYSGLVLLWTLPSGTTASALAEEDALLALQAPGQTDSGFVPSRPNRTSSTATDLARLRHRTGLHWSELARLFGVDRRSLHNWIGGSVMSAHNASILRKLLEATASIAQRLPRQNRQLLHAADEQNSTILEHLEAGRFAVAGDLLRNAVAAAPPEKRPPALSPEERMRRRGPSVRERLEYPEDGDGPRGR